jgi:hypothetical protein
MLTGGLLSVVSAVASRFWYLSKLALQLCRCCVHCVRQLFESPLAFAVQHSTARATALLDCGSSQQQRLAFVAVGLSDCACYLLLFT